MDSGTVARIEDWSTRPFSGGYGGLRDLADTEFTGAVSAGGAWLFMLNGRIVGVFDAPLSAVEGADGTAYAAPHPSVALLFAMRERGGQIRGRYYTDDTPLSEVDDTLSSGNFTGYVELSENVLSGDYYVVYYGGRSLSAAFVGSEERLLTGEEAFERANDEVGIYEVHTVDIEVTDVPEPSGGTAAATDDPAESDDAPADPPESAVESDDGPADHAEPADTAESADTAEPATDPADAAESAADPGDADADGPDATAAGEDGPAGGDPEPAASATEAPREADTNGGTGAAEPADAAGASAAASAGSSGTDGPAAAEAGPDEDPFSEEEEWRENRTIPALDPEETAEPVEGSEDADETADPDAGDAATETEADPQRVRELRAAVEEREERIAELEGRLEDATGERDRLRERVRELEAAGASAAGAARQLDPDEALSRTDVFVRYGSKGEATLEDAHDGAADREEVTENLRLETHTRFDADDVAVEGRPFGEFLEATLEHRFVRWVVEDLLYEIRDTDSERGLRDLYDALPRIDRIEYGGSVSMRDRDGEERTEPFDVILRDRMGQPLIVADLNDSRDPATSEMMSALVESATAVIDAQESLAAGFLVTASFFEPAALQTAREATEAGFLDRDARESFVKMSRKQGYHLCLVEARAEDFHVAVPEL